MCDVMCLPHLKVLGMGWGGGCGTEATTALLSRHCYHSTASA